MRCQCESRRPGSARRGVLGGAGDETSAAGSPPVVATRIAVEELEAWFLGDVDALRDVYPRLPATLPHRQAFRDPDAINGGCWEASERLLQKHGYHPAGLPKIDVADQVARRMNISSNRSSSFVQFRDGVRRLAQWKEVV